MSKSKFRITFYDGPEGNNIKTVDVASRDSKEAMSLAYRMPEAKMYELYTDMIVEEIPKEPSIIGIMFEYEGRGFNGTCSGCLFIKANDEAQAVAYYNKHFKNKRFNVYGKNNDDGVNVRRGIKYTYFPPAFGRYDADATIEKSVAERINDAKSRTSSKINKETDLEITR